MSIRAGVHTIEVMKSLTRIFRKEWASASFENRPASRVLPGLRTRPRHSHAARRSYRFTAISFLCIAALFSLSGCRVFRKGDSATENAVTRFFPGGKPVQPEPGELQQSLLQFAESYCLRIVETVDALEGVEGSPFSPEEALRFKIASVSSIIHTATGENPNINLLNLLTTTTFSRMTLENYWVKTPNGAVFQSTLEGAQSLEKKIWRIADEILTKEQQDEVRSEIEKSYVSLKDHDRFFMTHPEDLMFQKQLKKSGDDRSVFSLAAINPFSGLDPTVREIAQTRLFAERALFTIQWMPWLIRWQSDLLLLETTTQPGIAQTMTDVTSLSESIHRVSLAVESISETAASLPAHIASEREAIVTAMDTQEGQITTLFEAGSELSVSMNTAIESLDALMKRFGVGEPKPPRDPNRKRFDILDYAKTADSFTAMAEQLNATIAELNATLDSPALDKLSKQAKADARSIFNHIFLLAAGLVLLILASALIYRKLTRA